MIYTNKFINLISLISTTIIFFILNFYILKIPKIPTEKIHDVISNIENNIKDNDEKKGDDIMEEDLGNWYIQISSINLEAPIEEGTSMEVLNNKVGHFEETDLENGNVGLAGHNRGYEKNYFKNLKNVKIDDEIFYKHEDFEKRYIIDTIEIIQNTDWSYLRKTDENKITLITCVENEANLRRCVQATEIN